MSPIEIGRDAAAERAARELAEAGYQHEPFTDWVVRVVQQFFGDLLDPLGSGDATSAGISALIIVAVVAALGGLLFWSARRATRSRAATARDVFGDHVLTAAEHRALAERHAAEGRFAEAVRERLRAIARTLEERAILDPRPGRTAGELAQEAAAALPVLAGEFHAAARVFDDVTYGEAEGTPAGYATLRDLDERLKTTRPGTPAVAASSAASASTVPGPPERPR
ncbi:DUF4129 domain-containing protein [Spongiactinospora sp. TRM90649]|uniref:DUF4129 domain-containing protein n=1 Tax=Spongiactinospora sp. TRM90649 TaxID=3031114 RepID=UPI0023FA32EA|nr:DUF4129 domain-containing protein [Spongiactinospora sp. TRM90649]MDF5751377.1 DUF4129 domain-containing protein [Spongiactinospora sp. TRM90649]